MFRENRRKNKEISLEEIENLLNNEKRAVLAVNGDDGYPYGVPINFLYSKEDNKIYFHGSSIGHKADSIKKDDKVCFTLYGNVVYKEESWAPYVDSVVIFGRCHLIKNENIELLRRFAKKYYKDDLLLEQEIEAFKNRVQMYSIEIKHISGKRIQEK